MKYGDAILLGGISFFSIPLLGELGLVPYKFSLPVTFLVGVAGLVYWKNPKILTGTSISSSRTSERGIAVNEELNHIQKKTEEVPGYRRMNLDDTSRKNIQLHTSALTVTKNGEEHDMFGVVARPMNQNDAESICYILDCHTGQLTYDGERYGPEERKNPFHGTKWVENAGYRAKKQEETQESKGGVNIYQGQSNSESVQE